MHTLGGRIGSLIIALATAVAIIALVIPLFLNPLWVAFEQGRSEAAAWTGFDAVSLRTATDAILGDLVLGPPAFDVEVGGEPVLAERERAHMRDVRGVFIGFFVAAIILSVAALAIGASRRREASARAVSWRAVRGGAVGLIAVLVAAGGIALIAFDVAFELFHRVFFAGGTYTFDPAGDRLVQMFPFAFWQETAIAVGIVAIILAIIVAVVADGRARAAERGDAAMASTVGRPAGERPAQEPAP